MVFEKENTKGTAGLFTFWSRKQGSVSVFIFFLFSSLIDTY